MPIREFECPRCGMRVRMALPQGAVMKAVARESPSETVPAEQKVRKITCPNEHSMFVRFEL
ncbi:MAG: transcriptional regulator [Haloglomus sp.]